MNRISARFAAALLALALLTVAPAVRAAEDEVPTREDLHYEAVTATVAAINYDTRLVSLQFEDDTIEQFVVGPEVKRLNDVGVGDTLTVEYVSALGLELRAPTPEEAAQPFVVLEGGDRAAGPDAPAGGIARKIRAVATVEVLDRIHNSATLKGPRGNLLTIRVKDPGRLSQVRIGDTVVATYLEAVVVSLQKLE